MKIIDIEGIDGTGKTTQAEALTNMLSDEGYDVSSISFPRYDQPATNFIVRYLRGDYGNDPVALDPKSVAVLYATDRTDFFAKAESLPEILIVDRYTPSNMIHQGSKLAESERYDFVKWVEEAEYGHMHIPRPDQVIFLDLPTEISFKLLSKRAEETGTSLDIHESNREYLERTSAFARELADRENWEVIECADESGILPIPEITRRIRERIDV